MKEGTQQTKDPEKQGAPPLPVAKANGMPPDAWRGN